MSNDTVRHPALLVILVLLAATFAHGESPPPPPDNAAPGEGPTRLERNEQARVLTADVIALGTVAGRSMKTVAPVKDEMFGVSYAELRLAVDACAKGPCPDTLRFTHPGHAGAPSFRDGERVVVFLKWTDVGTDRILSVRSPAGKYGVGPDQVGSWSGRTPEWLFERFATILEGRDPTALYEKATLVVTGRVHKREVSFEREILPPERRSVFVAVALTEVLKGEAPADTITVVPPREPEDYTPLVPGEDVLLFLARIVDEHESFEIVGGYDGKHRIGDSTTSHVLELIGHAPEPAERGE